MLVCGSVIGGVFVMIEDLDIVVNHEDNISAIQDLRIKYDKLKDYYNNIKKMSDSCTGFWESYPEFTYISVNLDSRDNEVLLREVFENYIIRRSKKIIKEEMEHAEKEASKTSKRINEIVLELNK